MIFYADGEDFDTGLNALCSDRPDYKATITNIETNEVEEKQCD